MAVRSSLRKKVPGSICMAWAMRMIKLDRRRKLIVFHLFDEFGRLPGGLGQRFPAPVTRFAQAGTMAPKLPSWDRPRQPDRSIEQAASARRCRPAAGRAGSSRAERRPHRRHDTDVGDLKYGSGRIAVDGHDGFGLHDAGGILNRPPKRPRK
jgi:hypothetical protein